MSWSTLKLIKEIYNAILKQRSMVGQKGRNLKQWDEGDTNECPSSLTCEKESQTLNTINIKQVQEKSLGKVYWSIRLVGHFW